MYKRILVPLDGSNLAEQVLAYVRFLAKDIQARIQLLRVVQPPPLDINEDINPALYEHRTLRYMKDQAEEYLKNLSIALEDIGLTSSYKVGAGDPASCIVAEGRGELETVIAMSTHGRSGFGRWLMGSVTDKVLHTTPNPLFIVRPLTQEAPLTEVKLKTIIVPLDGSAFSEQVLPYVVELAEPRGLKVVLKGYNIENWQVYRINRDWNSVREG